MSETATEEETPTAQEKGPSGFFENLMLVFQVMIATTSALDFGLLASGGEPIVFLHDAGNPGGWSIFGVGLICVSASIFSSVSWRHREINFQGLMVLCASTLLAFVGAALIDPFETLVGAGVGAAALTISSFTSS
jgi:hypothetical protein